MDAGAGVRSVPELYAHALAIEREAAERYRELAERMADEGNAAVAALFGELAEMESRHEAQLATESEGMALPRLAPGEYAWLDRGAPESAAHDLVFRLMTPHDALEIALAGERRARILRARARRGEGSGAARPRERDGAGRAGARRVGHAGARAHPRPAHRLGASVRRAVLGSLRAGSRRATSCTPPRGAPRSSRGPGCRPCACRSPG